MGDEGEIWSEIREAGQKKRNANYISSLALLKSKGVQFREYPNGHVKIGDWNFWASTGKFYNEVTKEKGRGVFNLLKKLK